MKPTHDSLCDECVSTKLGVTVNHVLVSLALPFYIYIYIYKEGNLAKFHKREKKNILLQWGRTRREHTNHSS